mgnify:CR=1 FL=1
MFCDTVLTDLSAAFDKVSPVSFRIDYLETNPRGLLIAPPASACVRAVVSVEIDERIGELIFLLPNTAFEQVADVLSQNFTGGQLGGAPAVEGQQLNASIIAPNSSDDSGSIRWSSCPVPMRRAQSASYCTGRLIRFAM